MNKGQLASDIVAISNVTSQTTLVNDALNWALQRIYSSFEFPYYLQDKGVITTLANYNTGNIDVTQGSTSVVGHSTVWTSAMVGRKIQVQGQNAFYRITAVGSPTTLTIQAPFQGTTVLAQTYNIFQDEYRLASDLDKYKTFRQLQNNISLFQFPVTTFDELHPMPNSYADPIYAMMAGTLLDIHNTGTVSATANTNIITGSGTTWLSVDGLGRMNIITVPMSGMTRNTYTIKSVDSDTQITVYETIFVTVPASSAYQIKLNNVRVQLYQIPNAIRSLYYRYFRIPEPLVNDWDIPDMPSSYHYLLVVGALAFMYLQKGDMQKAAEACEAKFVNGIQEMKKKLGSLAPDLIHKMKSVDRIPRGVSNGLEASNYDRRWSTP